MTYILSWLVVNERRGVAIYLSCVHLRSPWRLFSFWN